MSNDVYIKINKKKISCKNDFKKIISNYKTIDIKNNHSDNKNYKLKERPKVSIILCTMRPNLIENVFNNYNRQTYENKEMIIILNSNKLNLTTWNKKANNFKNIKIFKVDEDITLGNCLNLGISKCKGDIIAKFDDDDYYGPLYLEDSIKEFEKTKASVIGKATSFIYFKDQKILAIRFPNKNNRYVSHMDGPSMLIKKSVFKKVKFRDIPRGVDTKFSIDCINNNIKIYSTNIFHHVYIRYNSNKHTWKINNDKLLRMSLIIKKNVTDFTEYVDI
ncbi:MAG: glycosyltransferase family 2 protein [Firmicutes bacterium]|nr:glycosyltransferase family 2 protein [Bacillota bacterium]